MKRIFAVLLGSAACSGALACDGGAEPLDDSPDPGTGECTAASKCSGCTSCFESCLCGGGSALRCSETCSASEALDAGSGDGGSTSPPAPYAATIAIDPFDIPAGDEFFRCQNFRNPFGKDVAILKTESFMTSGSHHLFVFDQPDTGDGELEPCSGLEFSSYIHLAQRSQDVFAYPEGVGRFLSGGSGLRAAIHFLNPSSETVHVDLAVTLYAANPEDVPVLASNIFINTFGINVPPHSEGTAEKSCAVPKDINVYTAMSHMHQHGVYYTARDSEGQLLFETDEWAEPEPWRFDPGRPVKAGSSINIRCEYENTTDYTLGFGESALTNEMCIFVGTYYPAAPFESITCLF